MFRICKRGGFVIFSAAFAGAINLVVFILHVTGVGSFPQPLSAKEEKNCFTLMKNGDVSARNKLIEHNLRLVAHIVKKYYMSTSDQDDLVSIGTIGLIKAVDTFDADKGIRLSSYAARCIENEILMFFRNCKKSAQDVSMNEPIDTDKDGNALILMDVMATEDLIVDELDTKIKSEQLYRYIDEVLSERERIIVDLRYGLSDKDGEEKTQKEVADMLGISQSYISRLEKKIIKRLKREMVRSC